MVPTLLSFCVELIALSFSCCPQLPTWLSPHYWNTCIKKCTVSPRFRKRKAVLFTSVAFLECSHFCVCVLLPSSSKCVAAVSVLHLPGAHSSLGVCSLASLPTLPPNPFLQKSPGPSLFSFSVTFLSALKQTS